MFIIFLSEPDTEQSKKNEMKIWLEIPLPLGAFGKNVENLKYRLSFVPLGDYITNLIFFDPYIRAGHGGYRVPDLSGSR